MRFMKSNEDHFTATQAMAMFESLRTDISILAEGQADIRHQLKKLDTLTADVEAMKIDITAIKDTIRIQIPSLDRRVTVLEKKVG